MRNLITWCGIMAVLVVLVMGGSTLVTAEDAPTTTPMPAPATDPGAAPAVKPPAELLFTQAGEAGQVKFKHEGHGKAACADCHEGATPLFAQARAKEAYKMADMYAGKACGACHDGKKAFAAKGDCSKCHESSEE